MQGGAPADMGPYGLGLHIHEQRHGTRCLPGAGVEKQEESLGKVPDLAQRESGNDHTTIYGSFSLRQQQPYMVKSAVLQAELRRWSLQGHSWCLLPGDLPAQAADLLPGKNPGNPH